jgi:hypothetical protein
MSRSIRYPLFDEACRFQLIQLKQNVRGRRKQGQQIIRDDDKSFLVNGFMKGNEDNFRKGNINELKFPDSFKKYDKSLFKGVVERIQACIYIIEGWVNTLHVTTGFGKTLRECKFGFDSSNWTRYVDFIGEDRSDHAEMKLLLIAKMKHIGISVLAKKKYETLTGC